MKLHDRNWRTETTFEDDQRAQHRKEHDAIVDFLCRYQDWAKASLEDDYNGIDAYYNGIPFDIKITKGFPLYCSKNLNDYELFIWYLENQDLDRFHNTNRIIVLLENEKAELDVSAIAIDIQTRLHQKNYFKNIWYVTRGRPGQEKHALLSKFFIMPMGMLVKR